MKAIKTFSEFLNENLNPYSLFIDEAANIVEESIDKKKNDKILFQYKRLGLGYNRQLLNILQNNGTIKKDLSDTVVIDETSDENILLNITDDTKLVVYVWDGEENNLLKRFMQEILDGILSNITCVFFMDEEDDKLSQVITARFNMCYHLKPKFTNLKTHR